MTHHATRTLQELGYRLTPQRTLVWDVLRSAGKHLSAEEICSRIQEEFPHINNSTVYRTLDLLVSLNLVRETRLGPARRFYEVEEEVPCDRDHDRVPLVPAEREDHVRCSNVEGKEDI